MHVSSRLSRFRTRANRSDSTTEFEQLYEDQHGDGERKLGQPVCNESIGIATELAKIREPGVCSLDRPAFAKWNIRRFSSTSSFASWRHEDFGNGEVRTYCLHADTEVTTIEMQRFHVAELTTFDHVEQRG